MNFEEQIKEYILWIIQQQSFCKSLSSSMCTNYQSQTLRNEIVHCIQTLLYLDIKFPILKPNNMIKTWDYVWLSMRCVYQKVVYLSKMAKWLNLRCKFVIYDDASSCSLKKQNCFFYCLVFRYNVLHTWTQEGYIVGVVNLFSFNTTLLKVYYLKHKYSI